MSEYPLTVRLYKADFNQPNPGSKVAEHTVSARRSTSDDDYDHEFVVIDPMNGRERGAYATVEHGMSKSDDDHFYWVGEVISGGE